MTKRTQSKIKILFSLSLCSKSLAAIATELKKQNPIAWDGSAWWPGGRTTAKPFFISPVATDEKMLINEFKGVLDRQTFEG